MSSQPEITQRDLRQRSKQIMDAVQRGETFIVTRDGHHIGQLIPLQERRRFVPRAEFVRMSRRAASLSLSDFRADQDHDLDQEPGDPYAR